MLVLYESAVGFVLFKVAKLDNAKDAFDTPEGANNLSVSLTIASVPLPRAHSVPRGDDAGERPSRERAAARTRNRGGWLAYPDHCARATAAIHSS